jgi:hypothetical protein
VLGSLQEAQWRLERVSLLPGHSIARPVRDL